MAAQKETERAASVRKARAVARIVCKHMKLPERDVFSDSKLAPLVRARMIAFHVCVRHFGITTIAVGEAFGKHHATIIHGIRIIERDIERQDPETVEPFNAVMALVAAGDAEQIDPSENVVSAFFALNPKQKRKALARIAAAEAAE